MNFGAFKLLVSETMRRDFGALTADDGTTDLVLSLTNMMRRQAQMRYTFQTNIIPVWGSVPITGLALNDGFKLLDKTTAVVNGESIVHLYEEREDGTQGREFPLETRGKSAFWSGYLTGYFYVRNKRLFYKSDSLGVHPVTLTADLNVFQPDLVNTSSTDFLLTYGSTWLLYEVVRLLQLRTKEDYRYNITARERQAAWETLIRWDRSVEDDRASGFDLE